MDINDAPNTELYKRKSSKAAIALWIHGNKSLAAKEAGIGRNTLYSWLECEQFKTLIDEKGAEIERKCFEKIAKNPQWQSQAWILERRAGEKYLPPKNRTELSGKVETSPLIITIPEPKKDDEEVS